MKAKHSVWKNKLAKTMFLMTVVLVAALFLGTAASAGIRSAETKAQNKTIALTPANVQVDGLAPQVAGKYNPSQQGTLDRGYFYAYNAYDPGGTPEGPITFDEPGAITLLASGVFPNFAGGADMDNEGNWYACDYAGGLYSIDPDTGAQTYIGSTIGVNGMTFDGADWYVTSSNTLYTMDVTTGATTSIGAHGVTNTFIGIACNLDGDMYGYDVLFTGDSTLYSIDKATGAATAVGSMGYGFVYAQDMGFDRDEDILYIAGYFNDGSPSALLTCDIGTGACTPVGNFQGGMEVDGFAVPWIGMQYDDDIAISSIVKPATGNAGPITPIVKVKNPGLNAEYDVDIQLDIGTEVISGTVEDFESDNGSYTHAPKLPQPDAWAYGTPTSGPGAAHSGVNLWATNLGGNYPASMWCYLITPEFTVPSGAYFNFWHWYYFENNYDGGNVKISNDSGTTWTLITPVGGYPGSMPYNPYMVGEPAFNGQSGGWKQANFDLSAYEGQDCMIMFETGSDSSVQYAGWYIDDVGFTITSWQNEYSEIATIPVIYPEETLEVAFPEWTPADLGMVEMVNINYNAEAYNLFADENSNNDYKSKLFNLHYGYFDDVAVVDILSPVNGLAMPQTPEVVIENHGQNSESVNVNMNIGKALYTTLLEEDFAGGVPPAGWGTTHPSNWMSSSTNYAGGTAPEAEFYYSPSSVGEHLLYTADIDTTGYTALLLKFKEYVNDYNGDYDLKIVTSTDGGATWNDAYVRAGGPYGPATTEVALTAANGVGSATFRIAWDLSGDSFNINYWYIDDAWLGIIDMVEEYDETVTVDIDAGESANVVLPEWTPADIPFAEDIDYLISVEATLNGFTSVYNYGFEEAWIPAVPPTAPPFPPAGWNIYNVNTGNTWVQSSSGAHSGSYCAKCTYDYSVQPNDDWLVTKPTVVAPGGIFDVWIDGYSYSDDYFQIWMSTTGNTTDDFLLYGTLLLDVNSSAPTVYTEYNFDVSAYEGMTVWFAIRYVGWYAWYIWADDFTFPDGSFEGFETGGIPGIPGHWPSFDQYVYGTTTDQWLSVTSGTSPTCSPPEGTYMAKYNSYSISSGNSAELDGTVAIDFSTATLMKFKMYHDTGYSGNPEVIYPLLSADGVNFWYDGTGFYRYDGTTGWKDETMDYSFLIDYLGGPGDFYIGFYAVSYYGNNMYMDDIRVLEASEIDDGYPADNTMGTIITLSYEHDVGVVAITEYPGSDGGRDIIWDNYGDDGTGNGLSSQLDTVYPFNSQCADDFQFTEAMDVDQVHWWGAFWNGVSPYPNPIEFNVIFYADDGDMPTGAGMDDPTSTALAVYNFPAVTGVEYGVDKFEYDVDLVPAFVADAGVKYWVAVQAVLVFADFGQWGWSTNGANPDQLSIPVQGFPLLGTNYWTQTTYGDHAFQLGGETHQGGGGGNPPPGTYGIAGYIENLGVTYPESDIPVNAQVTNDTGVIVYDETVIVPGPIVPGQMAEVVFPDIVIPDTPDAEYDYKLTMQTQLPGDDHPNNDKKSVTWIIQRPDITPPITEATLAGTMGDNDWYISDVTVTLTAYDPDPDSRWPTGVNHTYYTIDEGTEMEYETPFAVAEDGEHTVYFYSVDVAGNVEDEQSIEFKIDQTAPTITEFTATAQNALKTKWLLAATANDDTSGIVLVEFYADDALVGSVTTSPFEFLVEQKIHTAQCIVYDAAGNSKMSDVITAFEYSTQQNIYLQQKGL